MNVPPMQFPKESVLLPAFWEWINERNALRYFGPDWVSMPSGTIRPDNSIVWKANDIMDIGAVASLRGVTKARVRQMCQRSKMRAYKGTPAYDGAFKPWIIFAGDAAKSTVSERPRKKRSPESIAKQSATMKRRNAHAK